MKKNKIDVFRKSSMGELKFEILDLKLISKTTATGNSEWNAKNANNKGYSRGIKKDSSGRYTYESSKKHFGQPVKRFAAIYNLLSISKNTRLNIKFYCKDDESPFFAISHLNMGVCKLVRKRGL